MSCLPFPRVQLARGVSGEVDRRRLGLARLEPNAPSIGFFAPDLAESRIGLVVQDPPAPPCAVALHTVEAPPGVHEQGVLRYDAQIDDQAQ